MEEKIREIKASLDKELVTCSKEADLLNIKAKYLGKSSEFVGLMSNLKQMTNEEKKKYGQLLNETKKELEAIFDKKIDEINNAFDISFDTTLPSYESLGSLHPITIVAKEVTDILKRLGFTIVTSPEMETEYFNFDSLNIPPTHPARDMQDTYWLSNNDLLRTHTSPSETRSMQKYGAPLKICTPGRCFRNEDTDACHETTFFQIEGMVVDENISINNVIYVMKGMLEEVFQTKVDVRLRPGFFPFVEPGFELDCSCLICGGKGCPTCKNTGWLELCPCGMTHPKVFEEGKVDHSKYTGFAFGLGLTRLAMMKYKIDDIRILNSGDLRFLNEFNNF